MNDIQIAPALYKSVDAADFIRRLNAQIQEIPDFLYSDQISMKLEEYLELMQSKDDSSFLKNMRERWSHDLQVLFVKNGIFFDSSMRRKSIFSMLNKMNNVMANGQSINSIHDLMGLEFNILTPTDHDTADSINQMYVASNIILNYFAITASKSAGKNGERFTLCDASPMKGSVYSLEEMTDKSKRPAILETFRSMNPGCYIPEKSGIMPQYRAFVKDYYLQPKRNSCYQGVQFVVKTSKNLYFEIQIKTQPVCEYRDNPKSPAYHRTYKASQSLKGEYSFNLEIDNPQKVNIYGFRPIVTADKSGIIAPLHWELRKHVIN